MYCVKCGANIEEGSKVCQMCGQPIYEQQMYQRPMKWYKFVIYFQLFAGAVMSFYEGVRYFLGLQYGDLETAALVYQRWGAMKVLDIFMGLYNLAMIAMYLVTRQKLAKFRSNAVTWYLSILALQFGTGIFYNILTLIITEGIISAAYILGYIISYSIVIILMIYFNRVYFKKREDLFVN